MVDTHQAVRGSTPLWYQGGDLGLSSRDSARRARGERKHGMPAGVQGQKKAGLRPNPGMRAARCHSFSDFTHRITDPSQHQIEKERTPDLPWDRQSTRTGGL